MTSAAHLSTAIAALLDNCGDQIQIHAVGIVNDDKRTVVTFWTDSPGMLIGRRGVVADKLRADLATRFDTELLQLNIMEGSPTPPSRQPPPPRPPSGDRFPRRPHGTGGSPAAQALPLPDEERLADSEHAR